MSHRKAIKAEASIARSFIRSLALDRVRRLRTLNYITLNVSRSQG